MGATNLYTSVAFSFFVGNSSSLGITCCQLSIEWLDCCGKALKHRIEFSNFAGLTSTSEVTTFQ